MILHIFPESNPLVLKSYIRFINENFNEQEHLFITVNEKKNVSKEVLKYKNLIIIDPSDKQKDVIIFNLVKKSTKVLFHSLLGNPKLMFLILNKKSLFKKIYWIAWGHDLYEWKQLNSSFKVKVLNRIRLSFINNLRNFVGVFPPDVDYFKEQFKTTANTFYAPYVSSLYDPIYKNVPDTESLKQKIQKRKCINIQIGHHSTKTLNHIDVLEELVRFKNENIKIFIPLSYGDMEYAQVVSSKAKKLFGKKAIIMNEMIDKKEYLKHLANVDIAIFNTNRQIGLGNITPLLFLKKKLYFPQGTVMHDYYTSQGVLVCDYKKVSLMNSTNFFSPIDTSGAREYVVTHHLNKEKKIKQWDSIFVN